MGVCGDVLCGTVLCCDRVVWRCYVLCGAGGVWWCVVVRDAVWCCVPKAKLPKGNGRGGLAHGKMTPRRAVCLNVCCVFGVCLQVPTALPWCGGCRSPAGGGGGACACPGRGPWVVLTSRRAPPPHPQAPAGRTPPQRGVDVDRGPRRKPLPAGSGHRRVRTTGQLWGVAHRTKP